MYQHLPVQNIPGFVFGHGLTAVVRKDGLGQEAKREEEGEEDRQGVSKTTSVQVSE